jgi:diguanylate cyclase (GGDEF)-like protein/PAS domain S-box-containing protein
MENALHILLIEDTAVDAMLIERTLKKDFPNCCLICVDTRVDYIKAIQERIPDVILSDYALPSFDGMSALKIALELVPDVPFIIVTGTINEETAVECIKAGAWDYILKDRLMRLCPAIHNSLEQKKIRHERSLALKALNESEERYRNIFQVAPVCIVVHTNEIIDMINPAGLKLFGAKSPGEIIGKHISLVYDSEAQKRAQIRAQRLQSGEQGIYPVEDVFRKLDGTPIDVELTASLLTYNNKPAIQVILTDISNRKRAEQEQKRLQEALYREKEYLNSLIQNANAPIIIWTNEMVITEFNHAFEELTGYKKEEIVGKRVDETVTARMNEVMMQRINDTKSGKTWSNQEISIVDKNGQIRAVLWNSANITDLNGNYIATIVQGTDITERKKADENHLYLSYHDHLTNIYNRRYFEYQLKQLKGDAVLPLTIIMGDVNGLKLINDSFGHEAGDEILIRAASVITKGCREKDIVARLGGDEFGIILLNTGEEEAIGIIKQIKTEASKCDFDNALLSISFGYATMVNNNKKIEDLMMEAENFMYRRKMYESASMRNRTIDVIMNALYEKSNREMRHSQRVSLLSAQIAEKLSFGADEVKKIKISGLVHDIGKIGISEKILNKPGPLDEDEWSLIKKHPEAGWRILSSAKEFSDLAKQILHHHENWDGTGYPEGLRGQQIPIEARIIAVADAYDAMCSQRAYRSALKKKEVVNQFVEGSGKQFDPKIVDVFLKEVLKVK